MGGGDFKKSTKAQMTHFWHFKHEIKLSATVSFKPNVVRIDVNCVGFFSFQIFSCN